MYVEHPVFDQPADENEKVWRYMDFTKFVSLLESSSLYFAGVDEFDDPFEGSYPLQSVKARNTALEVELAEESHQAKANLSNFFRQLPRHIAINCWHLNKQESAAMWKLYVKNNEGIAIQSTYQNLRDCFKDVLEEIHLGPVNYIDYSLEGFFNPEHPLNESFLRPFVYKRRSFEHEREVRALVRKRRGISQNSSSSTETINTGVMIPVIWMCWLKTFTLLHQRQHGLRN
jgi:hypothetical protein